MSEPTPTGAVNPGNGTQPPAEAGQAGGQQNAPAVKTYTQEESNRIVGQVKAELKASLERKHAEALEQAGPAAIEAWREQHGFTEEVVAEVANRDQAAADLRNAKTDAATKTKELEALQGEHSSTQDQLFKMLGENAVYAECAGKCTNPRLLNLHIRDKKLLRVEKVDGEFKPVVYTEDGNPAHGSTIGDLVSTLLEREDMQVLAAPAGEEGSGSRSASGGNAGTKGKPDLMTPAGRRQAFESGFGKTGV